MTAVQNVVSLVSCMIQIVQPGLASPSHQAVHTRSAPTISCSGKLRLNSF